MVNKKDYVSLNFWRKKIKDKCKRSRLVKLSSSVSVEECSDTCKPCNYINCPKKHDTPSFISNGITKRYETPPPKVLKLQQDSDKEVEKQVTDLVMPIFNLFLKEGNKTPMGGRNELKKPIKFFWRPNNYRVILPFYDGSLNLKHGNTPPLTPHKEFSSYNYELVTKNYGTQHIVKKFNGTTVMVYIPKNKKKKPSMVVIYSNLTPIDRDKWGKAWYCITARSIGDIWERINQIREKIFNKCLENAELFCKIYGGKFDVSKVEFVEGENEVHGDNYIDKIPSHLIIHDTYFKKVYDKGVEFNSPVHVKNYISNRAVEEIAPGIAAEINKSHVKIDKVVEGFNGFMNEFLPVHREHSINIKTHTKVLKEISKGFKEFNKSIYKFNRLLSEKQKRIGDFL